MQIDYGYKVMIRAEKQSRENAKDLFYGNDRFLYNEMLYENGEYTALRQYTVCPVCKSEIEAARVVRKKPVELSGYEMGRFFSSQFRETTGRRLSLKINRADLNSEKSVVCPYCRHRIFNSSLKRNIETFVKDGKAYINVQLIGIEELINSAFSFSDDESTYIIPDPALTYSEILILDGASGEIIISLEDENGTVLHRAEISDKFDCAGSSAIDLIFNNQETKDFIKEYLNTFRSSPVPYSTDELGFSETIMLTKYRGFSKSYYNALPFELGTFCPEASFSVFRNVEEAVSRLNSSEFLKSKNIKKAIIENQGLLFFIDDLERLYQNINNNCVFAKIIVQPDIFLLLQHIHNYSTDAFFRDFCSTKYGAVNLEHYLLESTADVCECAKDYSLLNLHYRRQIQNSGFSKYIDKLEKWIDDEPYYSIKNTFRYSLPMNTGKCLEYADKINGVTFAPAVSTGELYQAGKVLNNCLVDWEISRNNIILMKMGTFIVGAVELSKDLEDIVQAKLSDNYPMDSDKELSKAFVAWCKKYDLHIGSCEDIWDFDGYYIENEMPEELPF